MFWCDRRTVTGRGQLCQAGHGPLTPDAFKVAGSDAGEVLRRESRGLRAGDDAAWVDHKLALSVGAVPLAVAPVSLEWGKRPNSDRTMGQPRNWGIALGTQRPQAPLGQQGMSTGSGQLHGTP